VQLYSANTRKVGDCAKKLDEVAAQEKMVGDVGFAAGLSSKDAALEAGVHSL